MRMIQGEVCPECGTYYSKENIVVDIPRFTHLDSVSWIAIIIVSLMVVPGSIRLYTSISEIDVGIVGVYLALFYVLFAQIRRQVLRARIVAVTPGRLAIIGAYGELQAFPKHQIAKICWSRSGDCIDLVNKEGERYSFPVSTGARGSVRNLVREIVQMLGIETP